MTRPQNELGRCLGLPAHHQRETHRVFFHPLPLIPTEGVCLLPSLLSGPDRMFAQASHSDTPRPPAPLGGRERGRDSGFPRDPRQAQEKSWEGLLVALRSICRWSRSDSGDCTKRGLPSSPPCSPRDMVWWEWGPLSLQPSCLLAGRPGVGCAGGQLLRPQVSSGASARPGHFLCAL